MSPEFSPPSRPVEDEPCARCGEPAQGFARINDDRYCHGDDERPSCYELASRTIFSSDVLDLFVVAPLAAPQVTPSGGAA